MQKLENIEAMKAVACLTAGKFHREFKVNIDRKLHDITPEDISWNVLNWVAHTGIDSLIVFKSAANVYDIELWDKDLDKYNPQITYVIYA
jgi:hypothetical protein